jgi:protein-tyrosine kinase
MSIIERALQKAQRQSKPAALEQPERVADEARSSGATERAALTEPTLDPVQAQAPRAAVTDASPTAGDMKRIVEIDLERLRSLGRLPPLHAGQQTEEEVRRIKWPLLSAIAGRGDATPARNKVILVTSAEPAEGKSYVALSLALSIVRDREMRVILVDGDVARPSLTPALDLEGAPGLNDVLADTSMNVNDVTYRTTVDGLFFLPAGRWHEHSPELIAGSRMPNILDDLSRRVGAGVVILDSPPLLATNEAQAATGYAGQVLLVVRAVKTEQRAVLDALALVDKSTPVRAVLNGVEDSPLSRYYGHRAYYYGPQRSRRGYGRQGEGRE